jgi:hypothetical protein
VELAAKYPGPKGRLSAALLDCGFLDRLDGDRFAIHDLMDHAPGYVHDRAKKEAERRKEKTCEGCGRAFHSADVRATHCSDGCRVRAHRDRNRQGETECNGSQRIDPLLKRIVTDRNGTPSPSPSPSPKEASPNGEESATPTPKPSLAAKDLMEAWNASPHFPACKKMTDARKKHLRARLADPSWASSWREALTRAAASPFLRGESDSGDWRMNIDWFLKPDSVTKILEGKYDRSSNGHAPATPPGETPEQYRARQLAENEDRKRRRAQAQQAPGIWDIASPNGAGVS